MIFFLKEGKRYWLTLEVRQISFELERHQNQERQHSCNDIKVVECSAQFP